MMTLNTDYKIDTSQSNLFLRMETERNNIPHMLGQDYIPIFIVNLLRDKICGNDDSAMEKTNIKLAVQLGMAKLTSEKWTDDSFLEEFAEFENSFLITDEDLFEYVNRVLSFAVEVMDMFDVDRRKFSKGFLEEIEFPPLELLWMLDSQYHLLSLSSYLMQLKHPSQIQFFQKQILAFCDSPSHFETRIRERSTTILENIIQTLKSSAYCNPGKRDSLKALKVLAEDILFQITEKLINNPPESQTRTNHQFLLKVLQEAQVPNSVKKQYFIHQLTHILTKRSLNDSQINNNLNNIIQYQEKYACPTFLTESQMLGDTITAMIAPPIGTSDLIEIISQSIISPTRNWERILRIITEWIHTAEYEATSALKEIIKDLMRHGLSSKEEEKVALAFVLARHCSLTAPKIFSRYEKWYSHMFESESYSPAKDPESFQFLSNLLSQWIPFEPSCFLQVQATFWPYIPVGCRSFWSDYVSLARVRVAEYNEVESTMEFEPNPNNPVQYDVEMTIKTYENTIPSSIPQSVSHMWMFRKKYYLDQFLPLLLKKPLATSLSDARLRLIEVLNRDGKIPHEMYVAYKSSKDG